MRCGPFFGPQLTSIYPAGPAFLFGSFCAFTINRKSGKDLRPEALKIFKFKELSIRCSKK